MKIGHGSNSGIKGLRDLGIRGILPILIYRFYPLMPSFSLTLNPEPVNGYYLSLILQPVKFGISVLFDIG